MRSKLKAMSVITPRKGTVVSTG